MRCEVCQRDSTVCGRAREELIGGEMMEAEECYRLGYEAVCVQRDRVANALRCVMPLIRCEQPYEKAMYAEAVEALLDCRTEYVDPEKMINSDNFKHWNTAARQEDKQRAETGKCGRCGRKVNDVLICAHCAQG